MRGSILALDERERQDMIEAGLTLAEANCMVQVGHLASELLSLTRLHDSDTEDWCRMIHAIQDKVLMRPAYRKYLAARDRPRNVESNHQQLHDAAREFLNMRPTPPPAPPPRVDGCPFRG